MPDFKHAIRARVAELGLSPVREAEIVEELSQHLEEEYERALSRVLRTTKHGNKPSSSSTRLIY